MSSVGIRLRRSHATLLLVVPLCFDSLSVSLVTSSVLHHIKNSIPEGSTLHTQQGEKKLNIEGMQL